MNGNPTGSIGYSNPQTTEKTSESQGNQGSSGQASGESLDTEIKKLQNETILIENKIKLLNEKIEKNSNQQNWKLIETLGLFATIITLVLAIPIVTSQNQKFENTFPMIINIALLLSIMINVVNVTFNPENAKYRMVIIICLSITLVFFNLVWFSYIQAFLDSVKLLC